MLLRVHKLCAGYGKLQVLSGVSLTMKTGESVAVLGPNGAGKTTLLQTLLGLIRPISGQVEYAGKDITSLGPQKVIRQGMVLVPQGRLIFHPLTVERNLELGGVTAGYPFSHTVARRQLHLVYGLFPRLKERFRQRAGTLSGGEQQMLAIGRALMADPKLLLLDEPSLGLAPMLVRNIFEVIAELQQMGMTMLLVEQNVNLALEYTRRVYLLNVGRVVLEETSEKLLQDTDWGALYLRQEPETRNTVN
jgi:branched-chain amino acid transport system ATP-binding protein